MTSGASFINILVAEDNDVSRGLIVATLKTIDANIFEATDASQAIDFLDDQHIDLAFVDINMSPQGGFEFIKHLLVKGIDIPVVIITADTSGDILVRSNEMGVNHLLQKPIDPQMLLKMTRKILERKGHRFALAVQSHEERKTDEQIMTRVIELAQQNVDQNKERPFSAVVTNTYGKIIGEGVSGSSGRFDPTAHAEVMAIRQACEKLGRSDLEACALYCAVMPTKMGKALIESVGLKTVYYALDHKDVGIAHENSVKTDYKQIAKKEAQGLL